MASSGYFFDDVYSLSAHSEFEWELVSSSAVTNTSVVSWKLLLCIRTTQAQNCSKKLTSIVYIDNKTYTGIIQAGDYEWGDYTIASGTTTIQHNADGTGGFDASFTITGTPYADWNRMQGSERQTLDTIYRYAKPLSVSTFTDENNPTLNYDNPAETSVTTLQACIANSNNVIVVPYRDISKTGYAYTFTLTGDERIAIRKQFTGSSTSKSFRFFVKTVIDGITYERYVAKTCTLLNYEPTLDPIVQDHNDATIALTGDPNILVKYYSNVYFDVNPEAKKESSISTLRAENGGRVFENQYHGYFGNIESSVFSFSVTDSRGFSASTTVEKELIPYVPLTSLLQVGILSGAGNVSFTISGKYFDGSFGEVYNALNVRYLLTDSDGNFVYNTSGDGWINLGEVSPTTDNNNNYTYSTTLTGLNHEKQYSLSVCINDKLTPVLTVATIIQAVPVFDWGIGDFRFNVPVRIGNAAVPSIIEQGTDGIWTYRKWSDGVSECWGKKDFSINVSTAWGSLYTSGAISGSNITFPSGLFAELPVIETSLSVGTAGGIIMSPGGVGSNTSSRTQTGIYEIARGTAMNGATYTINYNIRGRWK